VNGFAGAMPDVSIPNLRAGFFAGVRNVGIFLAALALVCGGINRRREFPPVHGISQKYFYFAQNRGDFDVLFLGTSRFYHSVIARRFDRQVAAATGRRIRSFNFGYDAMWPPENFYLLRQLLALHPPRLRWVFIECLPMRTTIDANTPSRRVAYWHDAQHTWLTCRAIAGERIRFGEKWSRWSGHTAHLLNQWTNAGLGAEWLTFEFGLEKRKKMVRGLPAKAWEQTEGYSPENETMGGEILAKFQEAVKNLVQGLPEKRVSRVWREELEKTIREIRAAGAQPVLVLTPATKENENYTGFPADVPLLRFQDPRVFPALFDPANHYDGDHLNDAGAQVLTDLLAARFSELLRVER
jgi:hypothetical protein